MKITLERIFINESTKYLTNIDDAPYEVNVSLFDDEGKWHEAADVSVFIDSTTTSLDEMRKQAMDRTRDFLTKALDAMNAQP